MLVHIFLIYPFIYFQFHIFWITIFYAINNIQLKKSNQKIFILYVTRLVHLHLFNLISLYFLLPFTFFSICSFLICFSKKMLVSHELSQHFFIPFFFVPLLISFSQLIWKSCILPFVFKVYSPIFLHAKDLINTNVNNDLCPPPEQWCDVTIILLNHTSFISPIISI